MSARFLPTVPQGARAPGMVTANHRLAAEAGAQILAEGGNAVDATVATSFALGVVEPAASGIGGRGYMVIHFGATGVTTVIDGHERAPLAARPDTFPLADARPVPVAGWGPQVRVIGDGNAVGHRAVAVPGVVAALAVAHQRYGSLPLDVVVQPAINLAADGFAVTVALAHGTAAHQGKLARFPAAAHFLPWGRPPEPGHRLVQADLARSYQVIAERGWGEFYRGSIARAIDAEMRRGDGLLTAEDLARFAPRVWDRPLTGTYRGFRLLTLPEATGGVTLLKIMNLLEGYDLGALPPFDPATLHPLLEVFRLAFVDRLAYVDDPAFGPVPFGGLVAKAYAMERRRVIDPGGAAAQVRPGDPWAFEPAATERQPRAESISMADGDTDTSHFCVVDRWGTVVAMTQSVVDAFGSGVVVPGTGILLNSAMHNFSPVPGQRGAIAPWKRSAHNAAPVIVLRSDGGACLAFGGAGGTTIVTGVAQALVGVLDRGWSVQESVTAPRVHNEGGDSQIDGRIPEAVSDALRRLGHRLETVQSRVAQPGFARLNGMSIGPDGAPASGVDQFGDAAAARG